MIAATLALAAGLLAIAPAARAQVATRSWILQSAATTAVGGTVAHASGFTLAAVQLFVPSGSTPHAVVQFEQALTDTHYTASLCTPLNGTVAHSGVSITPAGVGTAALHWRCNVSGATWFRARIVSISGGSLTIYAALMSGGTHTAARLRGST